MLKLKNSLANGDCFPSSVMADLVDHVTFRLEELFLSLVFLSFLDCAFMYSLNLLGNYFCIIIIILFSQDLLYVVPFIAKILEACSKSKVRFNLSLNL